MGLDFIESGDNEKIKKLVKLLKSSELRSETGEFLCSGVRALSEFVKEGYPLTELYFTSKAQDKNSALIAKLIEISAKVYQISDKVDKKISDTKSSQGIYAKACIKPQKLDMDKERLLILVLENISDPGNMGTLIRSADAFLADGIVLLGETVDIYNPKIVRSSAGALLRVDSLSFKSRDELFFQLKNHGVFSFAAVLDETSLNLTDTVFKEKTAIFIGNEGRGLEEATKAFCDQSIIIDMNPMAESLNAAVAGSILLWEASKKTLKKG